MNGLSKALIIALGLSSAAQAEEFSFEGLCAKARENAKTPHQEATLTLADFWKKLTYDQHRDIRFKMESGLWAAEKGPFSIDFFHPGWTAKKMVSLQEVNGENSEPLKFDSKLFDYGKQIIPAGTPSQL